METLMSEENGDGNHFHNRRAMALGLFPMNINYGQISLGNFVLKLVNAVSVMMMNGW
jgi:hypothetical protein